ncbi:MAG: hypothetical protein K9K86_03565 [Pseudomonadales bacterium]|nr:hypothetical protein [Pseudomonadales bacterium]
MDYTELLLAFDVGTTAVKGAVYTDAGECLFSSGIAYGKFSEQPGWVEQNPQDWMDCLLAIIERIAQEVDLQSVAGIGICSQVNTHVFVDEKGQALLPAIVWDDQRCAEITQELNHCLQQGDTREQAEGESLLDSSSLICRAEWVKRFHPEVWRKTHCILSPKDYCILQLTGERVTDALSSIGLVDANDNYLNNMLALVDGLAQRLPPIKPIQQVAGTLKSNLAGIRKQCPVVVGTMDCWASLFGSGAFSHGQGFQLAGTSEIIGLVSAQAQPATGVVTFPAYQNLYLHAGPTQAGGDALEWFAKAQGADVNQLLQGVENAEPAKDPLIFLPYLMGERAPIWDPKARGAFIGLTKNHGLHCMTRAVMEGVGFSARHLLEHLEQAAGYHCDALVISGGASRSDLWCQMKADIINRTLHRVENIDTGTFGAALMAATGAGIYQNLKEAMAEGVVINRSFKPLKSARARSDALYRIYRQSYQQLRPIFDELYQVRH